MTRLSKLILLLVFIPVLVFARGDYYKGISAIPSPVVYWRFEDSPGFTSDSSGSNTLTNSGVDEDNTYYNEGAQAASFVRTNSDYMTITEANQDAGVPWNSLGTNTKSFTVCFWVYWVAFGNNYGMFISKGKDAGNDAWFISLDTDTYKLNFAMMVSDAEEGNLYPTVFATGKWYHVAASYNGANNAYRVRIWDKTAGDVLDSDMTGTFSSVPTTIDAALNLGMRLTGATPYLFSNARMDDFRIFNTVLSVPQIDKIRSEND